MINIDCSGCKEHCCGEIHNLTPVLLPSEEERFRAYSRKIETPYRPMFVLAKKVGGTCIFLDDAVRRCAAYDKRPLECVLYPFLLDFEGNAAGVKLDGRFCPHLETLLFDKEGIARLLGRNEFTADWIAGYKTLDGF
jgi:Fe-S-cluster containining protein